MQKYLHKATINTKFAYKLKVRLSICQKILYYVD